jgi:hypothetical protein
MSIGLVQPNKYCGQLNTESEYSEYEVCSSVLGRQPFQIIGRRPDGLPILDPVVRYRKVRLRIQNKDEEFAGHYHNNVVDLNPSLYEPLEIQHVGQHFSRSEGNCHEYHLKMCETSCTKIETCNLNDKIRAEKQKEANKNLERNVKRRKGYKSKSKQPQAEAEPEQQHLLQPDNHRSSYSNFENFAEEYFRQ